MIDFMDTVRELRLRAGLTQAELAQRIGLSQPNISAYESGTRTPTPAMVERIRTSTGPRPSELLATHRTEVIRIVQAHRADRVRVFGSVARGEDRPGSDVDLLVDFDEGASLFDLVALADQVEDLLGVPVDVVSSGGLHGPSGRRIVAAATPL